MSKSIKKVEEMRLPKEYELLEVQELKDMKSLGIYLKHKKSGARLALVSNEDDNKVFYIGFRTPPNDSTGVAHIVEHTVLCGSKKFPSKDPFVELVKGSLNTFLNAVTYPDRTLYPVASCNDKDFKNLMHVYLDAVFYPNLYKNRAIFEQEGWHYELDEETGELKINGVVYNEMKGALSSPETIESERVNEALFPDSPYRMEYGGDPDVIPDLTYENYLDFHRKYYHPSNSYLYLYGDFDLEERLAFLDENYLSSFESIDVDSEIPLQKPVKKDFTETYAMAESEEEAEKTFLSYHVVTGESTDLRLMATLSLIQYVMTEVPGAPIKRALTEAGIGHEIYGHFSTSIRQPVFSIHASGSEANRKEEFVRIIEDCFKTAVEKGIPEKMLTAAINYSEFKYREQDFGRYPKGLLSGIKMCESWFYDETKPFALLDKGEVFDELRKEIGSGYFEEIIKTYILENEHKVILTLVPEKGKNEKKEVKLKERLANKKASMSEAEIKELKESNERLFAFQNQVSTKEELEAIPMLERSDIKTEPRKLKNESKKIGENELVLHEIETNGVVYLRMNFDASDISLEEIQYLNLLSDFYSLVNTEEHEYNDFISEVLMYTGGISTGFNLYSDLEDRTKAKLHFSVGLKVLSSELEKGLSLVKEMLYKTQFDGRSDARIKEILKENIMSSQMYFEASGDRTATLRGQAHTSVSGMINNLQNGLGFYRFIKDISTNFEEKKVELYQKLNEIIKKYFVKERVILSLTANKELSIIVEPNLEKFLQELKSGDKVSETILSLKLAEKLEKEKEERGSRFIKEAYTASGQVQYVARCGNFRDAGLPYTGLLNILQVILSYDYLWVNVRVKGGAYGCYGRFDRNGDAVLTSYRDPNLMETNEIYEGVVSYLENFKAEERDITKYIIGAISNIDVPLTPYAEGEASFAAYLSGVKDEDRKKLRGEILSATEDGIRGLSHYMKAVLESKILMVVGSEAKIKETASQFDVVESLLK